MQWVPVLPGDFKPGFDAADANPDIINRMIFLAGPNPVPEPDPAAPDDDELQPYAIQQTTDDEWNTALLTPPCIVENYLWEQIAKVDAPDGIGKSTLMIYELIHIILQRDLWGNKVVSPGPCLYVTAEDSRLELIAIARNICNELDLTAAQIRKVQDGLNILELLTDESRMVNRENLHTDVPERLMLAARGKGYRVIVLDPLSEFWGDESSVNDSLRALMKIVRRMFTELECCVRLVHHMSQQAIRDTSLSDQHTGRGGTALGNACRMVINLRKFDYQHEKVPKSLDNLGNEQVIRLHRPKTKWCKMQPDIWIGRNDYQFTYALADPVQSANRTRQRHTSADRAIYSY